MMQSFYQRIWSN